jgi:hypothetical protein
MGSLQRFLMNLFIITTSSIVILYSIAFVLPDSNLHTQRLVKSNFYNNIVESLSSKPNITEKNSINQGVSYIITNSLLQETITPSWLKGVVETNIITTSRWLVGETDSWEFYLPVRDIEEALKKNIDEQTTQFISSNKSSVPTCTLNQAETIRTNGFDLSEPFCIPVEVRDGARSLTDYLGGNSITSSIGFLDRVVRGLNLNSVSDIQKIDEFTDNARKEEKSTINSIKALRNGFVYLRQNVFFAGLLIVILLTANLTILRITQKNYSFFLMRSFFSISINIFVFSIGFVLFMGGSGFLANQFRSFLLPGFFSNKTFEILQKALFDFSVSLVTPALFIGLLSLVAGMAFWVLAKFHVSEYEHFVRNPQLVSEKYFSQFTGLLSQSSKKITQAISQKTHKALVTYRLQNSSTPSQNTEKNENQPVSKNKLLELRKHRVDVVKKRLNRLSNTPQLPTSVSKIEPKFSPQTPNQTIIQNGRPPQKQTQVLNGKPAPASSPIVEAKVVSSRKIHF